jgi:hypothetical protein
MASLRSLRAEENPVRLNEGKLPAALNATEPARRR